MGTAAEPGRQNGRVRVDHLLSKEHFAGRSLVCRCRAAPAPGWSPRVGWSRVCGVVLEGGTLTSSAGGLVSLRVRPVDLLRFGVGGRVWNAVGVGCWW